MGPESVVNTATWLGETIGFWIQTGAFSLSAIFAGCALIYNARQVKLLREANDKNERLARMRATIDVVLHENGNIEIQKCLKSFAVLRDKRTEFAQYACGDLTQHGEVNDVVLLVLNNYEFMAAGIRCGAFDEEIYRRMQRSTLIRDWNVLSGYVVQLRHKTGAPALFIEFEALAKKWEEGPANKI